LYITELDIAGSVCSHFSCLSTNTFTLYMYVYWTKNKTWEI